METITCEGCGAPLTGTVRFCPTCGRGVPRDGVTPRPMAATRPAKPAGPGSLQCGTCGTLMAAGNAYCFECGAPVGVSPVGEPSVRMQDAEAPPRKKMSLAAKILIVLGILALGSCGSCVACIVYGYKQLPNIEIQSAQESLRYMPPGLAALMPPDEAAFCGVVDDSMKAAKELGGSKATTAQIEHLIQERDGKLGALQVHDWVGMIMNSAVPNSVVRRGDAGPGPSEVILSIQTPCGPTFMNYAGPSAGIGIPMDNPLAETALRVPRYGTVRFSGEVVRGSDGKFQLNNFTPTAMLLAPRFLIQFSALRSEDAPKATP